MEKFLLLASDVLQVKKLYGSAIVYSLKCSVMELIGRNLLPYFFSPKSRKLFPTLWCEWLYVVRRILFSFLLLTSLKSRAHFHLFIFGRTFLPTEVLLCSSFHHANTYYLTSDKNNFCYNRTGMFINLISTWCYIEWSIDNILFKVYFISMGQQPPVGQGLLIIETSRWHSDTPHSVGRHWTSDQHDVEPLPDNTQHSWKTTMPPAGFEPTIPVS